MAADLSPMEAAALDPERVTAVVTAFGSPVSHGAILARSLGIPMVVGVGGDALAVTDGTTVVVDGSAGVVLFDPPPDTVREYVGRAAEARRRDEALQEAAGHVAVTTDGVRVEIAANIASADDVGAAIRHGADSVGLLRTEFLFLDRRDPPGEDEQFASYLSIADALEGRRLTIRTLDVGGDKHLPYLPGGAEANPFLGRRGIRLSLEQPELFTQQLRAIVRVGLDHPVSVLFPMVSTIDELRAAKRLLEEAATAVGCRPGELPPSFEVGVMVEVPALALHARAAAALVDLFSIGTNDLTQYTLAAERGNAAVAPLADPLDPAVLRLIAAITDAAGINDTGRRVRRARRRPRRRGGPHRARRRRAQHGVTDDPRRQAHHPIAVPRLRTRPRSPGARARVGGRRPRPHGVKAERVEAVDGRQSPTGARLEPGRPPLGHAYSGGNRAHDRGRRPRRDRSVTAHQVCLIIPPMRSAEVPDWCVFELASGPSFGRGIRCAVGDAVAEAPDDVGHGPSNSTCASRRGRIAPTYRARGRKHTVVEQPMRRRIPGELGRRR